LNLKEKKVNYYFYFLKVFENNWKQTFDKDSYFSYNFLRKLNLNSFNFINKKCLDLRYFIG
jgi:hypothetical protein